MNAEVPRKRKVRAGQDDPLLKKEVPGFKGKQLKLGVEKEKWKGWAWVLGGAVLLFLIWGARKFLRMVDGLLKE